jgi:hypothetical protein
MGSDFFGGGLGGFYGARRRNFPERRWAAFGADDKTSSRASIMVTPNLNFFD